MPQKLYYNCGAVTQRSMPIWPIRNRLSDPFGPGVLPEITLEETMNILQWAAENGLIELTGGHDDDMVPWDPEHPEDDLDENGKIHGDIMFIKQSLDACNIGFHTMTCGLHGHPLFRNGGLTNPDPKIREIAKYKVQRALRIGQKLGARKFTYWVARDGFETPIVTPFESSYYWLAEALNEATEYIINNNMDYEGATIEPKDNEPRGKMWLPTSGHAVGFILGMLDDPDFWGVNPELLQHEAMALQSALSCLAYLCSLKKLSFLHLGGQIKAQFDNDYPPLGGPEGLQETVMMFWVLNQFNWQGVVEYDCHMLRPEAVPEDPIGCRKKFIEICSVALSMIITLADRVTNEYANSYTQSESHLRSLCQLTALNYDCMAGQARRA